MIGRYERDLPFHFISSESFHGSLSLTHHYLDTNTLLDVEGQTGSLDRITRSSCGVGASERASGQISRLFLHVYIYPKLV